MIAATKEVLFNSTLVSNHVNLDHFEYPTVNWKYADIEFVLEQTSTNETLRSIISQCPLVGKYKRILIDVKVQNLVPDRTSCIPGWHLDGPGNPLHPSNPELHHLYIHETGGETEFIAEEFSLAITPDMSPQEISSMIPSGLRITKAKSGHFTTFTRFDFHRGINVSKSMKRLLVRLTESDTILPRNKPYKNAVGSI